MKLFLYDTKHQQVIAQKNMGDLTEKDIALVNNVLKFVQDNVLKFLQDNLVTDGRYKNLTLAEDIDVIYDDGEPQLVIRDAK